ncbi:unnamed protein product [Macrosiphum euphorbiae]|uniref:Uncharacterized protein n=1 Tax=Macrosiphum euphorbiae TaxID=13131 RepID=A0AAV0Y341_9HEMI|nr:unnamed protein product [Macrosiphum euphorbiae]
MDTRFENPYCLCWASTSKNTTYKRVPAASPWRTTANSPEDTSKEPSSPKCTRCRIPTGISGYVSDENGPLGIRPGQFQADAKGDN